MLNVITIERLCLSFSIENFYFATWCSYLFTERNFYTWFQLSRQIMHSPFSQNHFLALRHICKNTSQFLPLVTYFSYSENFLHFNYPLMKIINFSNTYFSKKIGKKFASLISNLHFGLPFIASPIFTRVRFLRTLELLSFEFRTRK